MNVSQFLLYPFSLLYGAVMAVRNQLYDQQYFSATKFPMPVISVGNLTVGGTGKTPHVEYLLRLLSNKKVATLSRGYKRQTKGYLLADTSASAATLGDEPFQYFLDFPATTVAVAENRVIGIKHLLQQQPDLEVIILDDAFQHRPVQPSLNILLTDYSRLFYKDSVLPAGRLREFPKGANRADAVVVTKCQTALPQEKMKIIRQAIIQTAGKTVPVFFTRYEYGTPVACSANVKFTPAVLLITAIAQPQPLEEYLQQQGYQILHHYRFPDHHAYTEKDIQKILSDWQRYALDKPVSVLTTRKDAVKLVEPKLAAIWQTMPLFYIPVKVNFLIDQINFDNLILNHVAGKR
ncbi:tetraacyldisaccharide 4'-kinase [Adhaeribacter radiodurans]|uniref:Tetraacyldisaccharide 4'-kinase n=1 Tax=Adhaeribacter radiodurans TaxID=2745197 RepID=A0A7L7L6Y1_9BACT|nr:tetraacyldisaccharide 4'-kinase [Adhaeribacter radiodurans]QMU28285.1 tetraacyldisaccharide 4'-kinase [Adhaeribacter radiodurans]